MREALKSAGIRGWEHFPHDADVGICGWGMSTAEAFEQAALALTTVVTQRRVNPSISHARRPISNSSLLNGSTP
jgi:hypothetical protein